MVRQNYERNRGYMNLSILLAIPAVLAFFTCILFVLFGQITVRKLRKNPETKGALGTEFYSGWDIINVAQAVAFPKSWSDKLEKGSLAFLYANASLIRAHTTKFDRCLGALFYWVFAISGSSLIFLVLADALGFSE